MQMGLFGPFAVGFGDLVLVLMDVTVAFLAVRALADRFPRRLLLAFDRAGAPLIDEVTARFRSGMERLLGRPVSSRAVLAVSLICLELARQAVYLILRAMVRL
jgi:hypothetical protein